ncbi:hypothetical protein QBC39DRAFT_96527 [Podospora conica]|nr:hypothetical protein QBC39DRAFT_96527 [Schizothecium conicum]
MVRAACGGAHQQAVSCPTARPGAQEDVSRHILSFGTLTPTHFVDTMVWTLTATTAPRYHVRRSLLPLPNISHAPKDGHLTWCRFLRERWGYMPHTDNISYMPATTLSRLEELVVWANAIGHVKRLLALARNDALESLEAGHLLQVGAVLPVRLAPGAHPPETRCPSRALCWRGMTFPNVHSSWLALDAGQRNSRHVCVAPGRSCHTWIWRQPLAKLPKHHDTIAVGMATLLSRSVPCRKPCEARSQVGPSRG